MQNGSACSSSSNFGIYLGAPTPGPVGGNATSIEDVYVNGFNDGIYVEQASDVILFNISGGTNVTNLIYISGGQSTTSNCPTQNGQTPNSVCDITIMGVTSSANNTIVDKVTNTTLSYSSDPTVGMYILGEQVTGGGSAIGSSRFTTSPNYPSWIVGTEPPTNLCEAGDLYSITSGTMGFTLWGCVGIGGQPGASGTWSPIL